MGAVVVSSYIEFAIWLLARQERDDAIGDFARDLASDIRVRESRLAPPHRTIRGLRHHVGIRGCSEAEAALEAALVEFRKARARRRALKSSP